jgi:spore coat protein U-like protein
MRPIDLLLARGGRRLPWIAAIVFLWLGMCQPAAAAISCSASMQNSVMVIYNGSAISGALLPARYSCSGLPVGGATVYWAMCTTSDAASSTGTGGTSVSPRQARSPAGDTLNFQLASNGGQDLTAAAITLSSGQFANTSAGTSSGLSNAITVRVPASQSVPAGDYYSTVLLTAQIRTKSGSSLSSCTDGTLTNASVYLNIPVTIRVGGAACNIGLVPMMVLGKISVNSGVVGTLTTAGNQNFWITCAAGTTWTATFSNGNNPLGTGSDRRRMVNGSSYLNYQLSTAASGGTSLIDSAGITGTGTGKPQSFTTYATLPTQTPASLTPGLYTDTVIMSLSY